METAQFSPKLAILVFSQVLRACWFELFFSLSSFCMWIGSNADGIWLQSPGKSLTVVLEIHGEEFQWKHGVSKTNVIFSYILSVFFLNQGRKRQQGTI